MKKTDYLEELQLGSFIKKIAHQRGVSAQTIANLISLYQKNADKIYLLDDMDSKDVVIISYLLNYNILDFLSKKYLPHLPFPDCIVSAESRSINIDMVNKRVMIYNPFNNSDFLSEVKIGQLIKKVAEKRKWKEQDMAKHLNCSQGTISNLYKQESLKVKKMIWLSEVLNHNLIAEAYLSKMLLIPSLNMIGNCIIDLKTQQIYIENPNNDNLMIELWRKNGGK